MNDLFLLTKLLFKANYSFDLKSNKGKKSIAVMILLVLCMLPTMGFIYYIFYSAFKSMNLDLMILQIGFCSISFLTLWTALFFFPSVFYFSNDLKHLLVYPIKPSFIVIAKFLVVYASLLLTSCIIMVPMIVAYIIAGNANIIQIILMILQLFLVPLVPAFIASIFWMIIFRFLPYFKNKDRFNLITGSLSILIACGIGIASSTLSRTSEDPEMIINLLKNNPEALNSLTKIFFHIPSASHAIIDLSIANIIINLVIILVSSGFFYICANKLYLISATNAKGTTSQKKRNRKEIKSSNPFWSYFKNDLRRLLRAPAYFSNCVLSSFISPIIMIVVLMTIPEIGTVKQIFTTTKIIELVNLPLYLYAGGMIIGFFFGSLNGVCATAFSREGKNISFMMYIPMNFSNQILSKCLLGILFSLLSSLLFLVPIHTLLSYPIYYDIAFLIGALITTTLVNYLALLIDGIHPKLDWEDETSVVKNNFNVVFEFLSSWIILAILIVPLFMFNLMNHLEVYMIIISILLVLINCVLFKISPQYILKSLRKSH